MKLTIIDDDYESFTDALQETLNGQFQISGSTSFEMDAFVNTLSNEPGILLLDILDRKGHEAGIKLFEMLEENQAWKDLHGSTQIVFFSSDATAQRHAMIGRARRADVAGFVSKQDVISNSEKAREILSLAADLATLHHQFPELADPVLRKEIGLVFSPNSRAMHDVWCQIVLAGRSPEPVLISGETGTGKEVVARGVWEAMNWHARNHGLNNMLGTGGFIPYNIGAAPSEGNLQYSELFGANKGSATGMGEMEGLFRRAARMGQYKQGGTVFLDEIGDAPHVVQVSLLRVLQDKRVIPLGGFNDNPDDQGIFGIPVKFRLISASNVNMKGAIKDGRFREDLFHRLNVLPINIPPLRERKEDVFPLCYWFLDRINDEYAQFAIPAKTLGDQFASEAFDLFLKYEWPGNVRELESVLRRCFAHSPGEELILPDSARAYLANSQQ